MILYNWQKIFETAERDANECFRIFKMLTRHEIPQHKGDPIYKYSQMNFLGTSFLLHPDVLLYHAYKYDRRDVCIYLALASRRAWADYVASRTLTLDLATAPLNPHHYLSDNSLLPIRDGKIHFIYEEVPKEKEQH
jgi:hypothetical protein